MTLLSWKDEFATGIESVDFEHREMIALINDLHAEMVGRKDSDSIEQFLGDVHAAISAHFALEERIMQRSGYHEYLAHKENHEELLDQIRDLMDMQHEDADAGLALLQRQLANWFEVHFASFDARLHGQLHVPGHP